VVGAEAIRSLWQTLFDQVEYEFRNTVEDVRVAGDLAALRGAWTTVKATPKAQALPLSAAAEIGLRLSLVSLMGSWKYDWIVVNSDQPPPGSTVSGEDEQDPSTSWNGIGPLLLSQRIRRSVDKFLAEEFVSSYNGRMAEQETGSGLSRRPIRRRWNLPPIAR